MVVASLRYSPWQGKGRDARKDRAARTAGLPGHSLDTAGILLGTRRVDGPREGARNVSTNRLDCPNRSPTGFFLDLP